MKCTSSACCLSVNNFVNTTLKLEPKTTQINIVYAIKDAIEDKFGKVSAIPLLIFLTKSEGGNKEILDYNQIIEKYGEDLKITLPKPERSRNGYANMQIDTESTYSEKYQTYYYKKQYGDLTNKVVSKATESQDMKQQHDVIEVLDI